MEAFRAVVLPGQGSFGDCMGHLNARGFSDPLSRWIREDRPYLGICLGLQILFEQSDESPGTQGLGLYPGCVKRFELPQELKVPQIGWNRVNQVQPKCGLFRDLEDGSFFYFVHSYYVEHSGEKTVAATTEYGLEYTSAVATGRIMAVQFHPEKSQRPGLQLLKNFMECIPS